MKRILLTLTVLFISLTCFGQAYPSGDYTFSKISSGDGEIEIRVEKNGKPYDVIVFKEITDISPKVAFHYNIGNTDTDTEILSAFTNKEVTKFYFGNFLELFEYDIKKKSVEKMFTSENTIPQTTYRITGMGYEGAVHLQLGRVANGQVNESLDSKGLVGVSFYYPKSDYMKKEYSRIVGNRIGRSLKN